MRNIKFLFVCLLQLALVQLVVAQDGDDKNGRPEGSTPEVEMVNQTSFLGVIPPETGNDDRDVPSGVMQRESSTTYYPQDLDVLGDELLNSAHVSEMVAQIEAMKRLIREMNQNYEELKQENHLIRRSLNACCSANQLGLTANDAYLLQNSPNPFTDVANIAYYVPEGLSNVQIELRDVKGVLIKSFSVVARGMDEMTIESAQLQSGTYLYYLNIDGEVVDSKVMILNK